MVNFCKRVVCEKLSSTSGKELCTLLHGGLCHHRIYSPGKDTSENVIAFNSLPSRFFAEGFPGCPFSKLLVGPVFVFVGFSDSALKQSLLKPKVPLSLHVSVSSIAAQAQMNAVLFRQEC